MKRILRKSLRQQKRSLETFAQTMASINEMKLKPNPYLTNLLATNQRLLNSNNVNNLLLF